MKKNFTFRIEESAVKNAKKAAKQNKLSLNKQVEKALAEIKTL